MFLKQAFDVLQKHAASLKPNWPKHFTGLLGDALVRSSNPEMKVHKLLSSLPVDTINFGRKNKDLRWVPTYQRPQHIENAIDKTIHGLINDVEDGSRTKEYVESLMGKDLYYQHSTGPVRKYIDEVKTKFNKYTPEEIKRVSRDLDYLTKRYIENSFPNKYWVNEGKALTELKNLIEDLERNNYW